MCSYTLNAGALMRHPPPLCMIAATWNDQLLRGFEGPALDIAIIFLAQVIYVSTMTLRWILLMKGNRTAATAMSFFEVAVWVYALSLVVTNLSDPLRLVAYAGGYAAGTALGMWLEERLALGYSLVLAVVPEASTLAKQLRRCGFAVTTWAGAGRNSMRQVLLVFYRRRLTPDLKRLIDDIEPSAFVLTMEPRIARGGFLARRLSQIPLEDPEDVLRGNSGAE